MMATEVTSENIVTIPSPVDNDLVNTLCDQPKSYVLASEDSVLKDDEVKQDLDLHETKSCSAAVSVSGDSDSDTLKADSSKAEGEEKGHLRTTSAVKKTTSFKAVSVNKKFLATKGTASTAASKLGDKNSVASTSAQVVPLVGSNSARPRLVAKSGPGLNAAPRATNSQNGVKAGVAPDPNAVWNKNRPAPPPEPKLYSDEELKQRYGIHLASRLRSDDAGKQANWADIDEDDEDWDPCTVEWADGTKVTLPQADEAPMSAPAPASSPSPKPPKLEPAEIKEKAPEPVKPKSPISSKNVNSPTVKTMTFSGRAGLVLKGATEKPTLVAKLPGPSTSVKSPWAPLPPIEKVVPVFAEAPQQQQSRQNRFIQKEMHGINRLPSQEKEIATDDSRRSWRDAPNPNREVIIAQSTRSENSIDKRRRSMRNETRSQQPAVLQRSLPETPAEPSPSFQTNRSCGLENISRRRNSSNVSVGSEKVLRKMSRGDMPLPNEAIYVRRGSLAAVSDEPSSPCNSSTSVQQPNQRNTQNQTWQPRASPVVSYHSPQSRNGQPVPIATASVDNQNTCRPVVYEDPFEFQKKAMLEKRELAVIRRRDQMLKEEAEKNERIRIKLASMEKISESKNETVKNEKLDPPQNQACERAGSVADESKMVESESKGSGSNATETNGKNIVSVVSNCVGKQQPSSTGINPSQTSQDSSQNNSSENTHPSRDKRPSQDLRPSNDTRSSNDTPSSQSWHSNSSDRFKPWAPTPSQTTSSRNVWGPPTNDRTLGNGTFNPELSRVPEISAHPGLIGPLNPNRGSSHNQVREYSSRPSPIGPPNRRQIQGSTQDISIRSAVANSGWGSLPKKIAEEDSKLAQRQENEISRIRELREKGLITDPPPPVVHDTWRQVSMRDDGTRTKIQSNSTTIHNNQSQSWQGHEKSTTTRRIVEESEVVQRRPLDKIGSQPQFTDAWETSKMNVAPVRDSRFFPNNKDVRLESESQNISSDRPDSPSPPPPTQIGHPAYDGDIAHPNVSLPRPPPIVKLPPPKIPAPISHPKPTSFAAVVATPAIPTAYHGASRVPPRTSPIRDVRREEPVAGNWQDKIYSLFGRKSLTSTAKPQTPTVDSSSKNVLEVPNQQKSATVSLPSLASGDLAVDIGSVESKPPSEVCFEEQEMGSLPPVRLPLKPPTAAWDLAPSPKPLPKKFLILQSTSVEPLSFPQPTTNNGMTLTIKVPGQLESKNVLIQITRQKTSPRRGSTRIGTSLRHSSSSSYHRGRGRDLLSSFSSNNMDRTAVSSDLGLSSRGRGRGQSNTCIRI